MLKGPSTPLLSMLLPSPVRLRAGAGPLGPRGRLRDARAGRFVWASGWLGGCRAGRVGMEVHRRFAEDAGGSRAYLACISRVSRLYLADHEGDDELPGPLGKHAEYCPGVRACVRAVATYVALRKQQHAY